MRNIELNGIMPPVPTPFDANGDLDLDGLARNIGLYNETGLAGYVALGSNGETVHLSGQERLRVIETIKKNAAPRMTVIAGVNEFSTRAAIESARAAAGVGAEAALVITPFFYKSLMTQGALLSYFTQVADGSPIPVLIYNVPQNTGVIIDPPTVQALAAHENIIGIKDSAGNMGALSDTIRRAPADFSVLVGNGGILYPSLLMGARGAVLAVACAAPRACVDLYEAVKRGDHERARDLQNRIAPLSQIVTAGLGVPGLKAAMEMAGFVGGAPRSPLAAAGDADREKVRGVMRQSGLFSAVE